MGDIVVVHFLETLGQLSSSSNEEVKNQLNNIWHETLYLARFLDDTSMKRNKHPEIMKLVMQIRETCDADNIVSKADHPSDSLCEFPDHLFLDLERVEKVIKNLMDEVKQIYDENMYDINGAATEILEHSSNRNGGVSGSSGGMVKNEVVIGFGKDMETLMNWLNGVYGAADIVVITGMAGGGKTTLASEVYFHPLTREKFDIRAWIVVSQDYRETMRRDLLIGILKSACPKYYDDHYEKSDVDELGEKVYRFLTGKRYLIVMDDILFPQAWKDISRSLPRENNKSKVIFTCRQSLEVDDDNIHLVTHSLCSLSPICSWELLEKKVFGKKRCPPELVEIGKQIANQCDGLPLAIITAAGILANEEKTPNAWEKIAKSLNSIIARRHDGCMETLELSYNCLPLNLRACFLYIGAHPKDYEISARELIWLWIAEGFIQQNEEGERLEEIAYIHLWGLFKFNLIMMVKGNTFTWKEEVKTCFIHDLLRHLCLKKAKEDNFFVQIDGDDCSAFSVTNKHSRLFIFRQFFNEFFFSRLYPRNLRSFICLGSGRSRIEVNISFFVENFKLLRILSFTSDECRGEILRGQLVHLRYLALRLLANADFRFPFHLVKLETFIVQTSCFKDIKLSRDILEMVKLRHLKYKQGLFTYHGSCVEDEGNTLDSLQTLYKMCICKRCLQFLKKTPNLRKLGLVRYPDTKGDDDLKTLELEFLKCVEILYVESRIVARTRLKLPPSLTKLTLCHTQLQWKTLSIILKKLPGLRTLKLLMDACIGPVWDTSKLQEEKFARINQLTLRDLDIEEWRASKVQFRNLQVIVIQDCRKLKGIPNDSKIFFSLCKVKVERSSRSVEESAKRILEPLKISRPWLDYFLSCNSW